LNGSTRLSGLAVSGSSYFIKLSFASDFDNKIPSTVESGFEAGVPGRVERTPEMFRLALYSPLLPPSGTRECHKI